MESLIIHREGNSPLILGFIALACSAGFAFAQVPVEKEDFRIEIPMGWIELPDVEVNRMMPDANAETEGEDAVVARFGFRPAPLVHHQKYPFILVEVRHSGRIEEKTLAYMEKGFIPAESDVRLSETGFLLQDIRQGANYFGSEAFVIWEIENVETGGDGDVSLVTAKIPTETGTIQLTGYCDKTNVTVLAPLFARAAISIEPSKELRYDYSWKREQVGKWRNSNPWLLAIVVGILLLVSGFFDAVYLVGRAVRRTVFGDPKPKPIWMIQGRRSSLRGVSLDPDSGGSLRESNIQLVFEQFCFDDSDA